MPSVEAMKYQKTEMDVKYEMESQIGVEHPVLPVYIYDGKKYIQNGVLHYFIPMTGRVCEVRYDEWTDEHIANFLDGLRNDYGLDVSVKYVEMTLEQATLINEPEKTNIR